MGPVIGIRTGTCMRTRMRATFLGQTSATGPCIDSYPGEKGRAYRYLGSLFTYESAQVKMEDLAATKPCISNVIMNVFSDRS